MHLPLYQDVAYDDTGNALGDAADLVDEMGQASTKGEMLALVFKYRKALREAANTDHAAAMAKVKAKLEDPALVHVAMLRGEIARPDIRTFLHAHGERALARWDSLAQQAAPNQSVDVPSGKELFIELLHRVRALFPQSVSAQAKEAFERLDRVIVSLKETRASESAIPDRAAVLEGLLRRLRAWDQLAVSGDGNFWIKEIDEALSATTTGSGADHCTSETLSQLRRHYNEMPVRALDEAGESLAHVRLDHVLWFLGIAETQAAFNPINLKTSAVAGPGTPAARFEWIMDELNKRFPDPEPWSARAPEIRLLALLDSALARLENVK